jgi:hypothetical protein
MQFGLMAQGRFDGGDNTWLGDSNAPGEWAIACHGTKAADVRGIREWPLQSGPNNVYGKGIYCSSNPSAAEAYNDSITIQEASGRAIYRFMFVCRVNIKSLHYCIQFPCPQAADPQYTLHCAERDGLWFVNGHNGGYETIRLYGILIKRAD